MEGIIHFFKTCPAQRAQGSPFSCGYSGRGVRLTVHLHSVPKLKNEWRHTFHSLVCLRDIDRDNFSLTLLDDSKPITQCGKELSLPGIWKSPIFRPMCRRWLTNYISVSHSVCHQLFANCAVTPWTVINKRIQDTIIGNTHYHPQRSDLVFHLFL